MSCKISSAVRFWQNPACVTRLSKLQTAHFWTRKTSFRFSALFPVRFTETSPVVLPILASHSLTISCPSLRLSLHVFVDWTVPKPSPGLVLGSPPEGRRFKVPSRRPWTTPRTCRAEAARRRTASASGSARPPRPTLRHAPSPEVVSIDFFVHKIFPISVTSQFGFQMHL